MANDVKCVRLLSLSPLHKKSLLSRPFHQDTPRSKGRSRSQKSSENSNLLHHCRVGLRVYGECRATVVNSLLAVVGRQGTRGVRMSSLLRVCLLVRHPGINRNLNSTIKRPNAPSQNNTERMNSRPIFGRSTAIKQSRQTCPRKQQNNETSDFII